MVNIGGALCPSLKINFKKLAAESKVEPIKSLPPSPTEHAPRIEQSPETHAPDWVGVGSNGGWSCWWVRGLRELIEVEVVPL
jgi:hypothetical protein